MICFLTSCNVIPGTETLNPANHFISELRRHFPKKCRGLFICSDPDDPESTDFYAGVAKKGFEEAGFHFRKYSVLDGRNEKRTQSLVNNSDLIILAGGHVPTQNRFFRRIGLREALKEYPGVIIGISAGSMNGADTVYAQPEREGEAADPEYQKFLTGLGLTKTMILPHYQEVKDDILDGMRLFEEITLPDSMGRTFFALPDGSYLMIEDGREKIRGEAYMVRNGTMTRISDEGDTVPIPMFMNGEDRTAPSGRCLKHKVKLTVIDKKLYPKLQKRFCTDPESGYCPCYNIGDEFVFYRDEERDDFWHMGLNTLVKTSADPDTVAGGPNMPHCSELWDAISRYIYTGLQGGSIMQGWMKRENEMIACCSDGTRPVIFKIERIDYEEE